LIRAAYLIRVQAPILPRPKVDENGDVRIDEDDVGDEDINIIVENGVAG